MRQSLSRRKAAERFVEILRALEVAVDQLDLGIIDGALGLAKYNDQRLSWVCCQLGFSIRRRKGVSLRRQAAAGE